MQKINEIKAFLCTEVQDRHSLRKKYRRAVNALEATCGALGGTCIATGTVGAGLLASGVGFVAGLVLEVITGAAVLLDAQLFHQTVRVLAIAINQSINYFIVRLKVDQLPT